MAGRTILVVEDDPVVQRLIEVNFSMEGWAVVTANDGLAGLAAIRAERPDCILSDIMMPKMTGLELLALVLDDPDLAAIPVILLSAKAQSPDVQAGLDAGAADYVTKPFEPMDLLERVEKVLAD
ncbi:MAG TPA: response regulator [Acidimicrobiales bacterium]